MLFMKTAAVQDSTGEEQVDNPKPRNINLKTGDIVVLKTAGAGGYGPVEERDKDLIRKELKEGIIDSVWLKENGIII